MPFTTFPQTMIQIRYIHHVWLIFINPDTLIFKSSLYSYLGTKPFSIILKYALTNKLSEYKSFRTLWDEPWPVVESDHQEIWFTSLANNLECTHTL